MPAIASTFTIGTRSYRTSDWGVFRTQNGRTVRRSTYTYGDGGYLYLFEFRHADGTRTPYTTPLLAQVNVFLSNPTAWEANEDARVIRAEQSGSFLHSVVSSVGHALGQVGNVVGDVVDFGIEVNEAVLHPLTVNSSGLQLSSDAIQLVPESLQNLTQSAVAVLGYGVVAGAALTAVGGVSALSEVGSTVGETVSSVAGAVSGAQEVLGAVSGLLPTGVTPIISPAAAVAAAPGVFDDATRGFAEGIGPYLLLGFVFIVWFKSKR